MNTSDPDELDEIICQCSGTTKAKIKELINRDVDNLDKIENATGANTGCGSCDALIMEILSEYDG